MTSDLQVSVQNSPFMTLKDHNLTAVPDNDLPMTLRGHDLHTISHRDSHPSFEDINPEKQNSEESDDNDDDNDAPNREHLEHVKADLDDDLGSGRRLSAGCRSRLRSRSRSESESSTSSLRTQRDAIIHLRVAGRKFSIARSSLLNFPQTRLGQLALRDLSDQGRSKVYYFDRNSKMMSCLLDLYRTGELHLPKNMCGVAVFRELRFWGIDDRLVSECCWQEYKGSLQDLVVVDELSKALAQEEVVFDGSWRTWVWLTMERPGVNLTSTIWFFIYVTFIGLSVTVVSLATVMDLRESTREVEAGHDQSIIDQLLNSKLSPPLVVLDMASLLFFTVEPLIRVLVTPDLKQHLRQPLTIMDIGLATDHWVCVIMEQDQYSLDHNTTDRVLHRVLRGLLSLRVFRIFHVVRKYAKMKVLTLTFRASFPELFLLFLGLSMAIITFATLIYYAEMTEETDNFQNIPQGIWWAVVTMTTVGYGDVYPTTVAGYVVGILCSLSGVLLLSMPIAIIAGNFKTYYSCLIAREQRVRRANFIAEGDSKHLNPVLFADSSHALANMKSEQTGLQTSRNFQDILNDFSVDRHSPNNFKSNGHFGHIVCDMGCRQQEIANSRVVPVLRETPESVYNLGDSTLSLSERLLHQPDFTFLSTPGEQNTFHSQRDLLSTLERDEYHPFHKLAKEAKIKSQSQLFPQEDHQLPLPSVTPSLSAALLASDRPRKTYDSMQSRGCENGGFCLSDDEYVQRRLKNVASGENEKRVKSDNEGLVRDRKSTEEDEASAQKARVKRRKRSDSKESPKKPSKETIANSGCVEPSDRPGNQASLHSKPNQSQVD